jgi:predicted dehydrogenase
MRAARLGVIGAGTMGAFHAAVLSSAATAKLVVVADVRTHVAAELAAKLGCEAAESIESVFTKYELDGVVIATPVETHVALVERAALAGVGIFCEKPLAATLAGCARAIEAADQGAVPLQVGFHRRFDRDYRQLHRAVADGELGDIYMLKSTLRDMTPPSPEYIVVSGGYFKDAFIHDFDCARWLAGEIDALTATGTSMTGPFETAGDFDNAIAVLRFSSGALGILDGSRVSRYGYECSTEVVGSVGTARVENPHASNVVRLHAGRSDFGLPTTYLERFEAAYATEMEGYATMLCADRKPEVDGHDALLALALAEAAALSAKRGETVVLEEVLAAPSAPEPG